MSLTVTCFALSFFTFGATLPIGIAAGAAGGLAAGTAGGLVVKSGTSAALGAAGFTSAGVAKQSLASSCQSLYKGGVPAGGWFATCQSAGVGGARGTVALTTAAVVGGVACQEFCYI